MVKSFSYVVSDQQGAKYLQAKKKKKNVGEAFVERESGDREQREKMDVDWKQSVLKDFFFFSLA